jgi:methyl-accepting chemotaxis protein
MLNKVKIGPKLIGGFAIVALIALGIGTYGIINIKAIDKADSKLYTNGLKPFEHVIQMTTYFQRSRVNLRDMVRATTPEKIQYFIDRYEMLVDSLKISGEEYEKTLVTEAGKKKYEDFSEALANYSNTTKIIERFAKEGKKDSAGIQIDGATKLATDHLQKIIYQIADQKINFGKDLSEGNSKQANTTVIAMIVTLAIGIILALIIGVSLTTSITKPMTQGVLMMQEMSKGHLGMRLKMDRSDEIGELANAMDTFADDLQKNVIATMQKISNGDLSSEITAKDNQDEISPALKKTIDSLRGLVAEAVMLTKAAIEGRLQTRGNAAIFKGSYAEIVTGVNSTLDAVIGPLNVAAKYVDDISKGIIPPAISDNYNGDFNVIKTNLNTMVKMMENLLKETDILVNAALTGSLSTRANAVLFVGGWNQLVAGINKTLDSVLEPINEAAGVLDKVAARDLTARVAGDYKGDHAKIKNALNLAVDNIDKALQQVSEATEQVTSASQQISSGSQSLAQGANEQASSLEEVSSSLEEMASMTKQSADNAIQAKSLAGEADQNAKTGTEAMIRMSNTINRIKESSDQTAKIVKTIDEIAMQTNLLALNAAVEAARAGEAGRGFAVVAEEVRNLAQRSAQAAKNTADMISESVKNADDGVKIAGEVSVSFTTIATSANKVNDLIAEIAAASQEQSQGIDQVNGAVAQMDKVTQQNAANSEESASAAEELSSQAEELKTMIDQFSLSYAVTQQRSFAPTHSDVKRHEVSSVKQSQKSEMNSPKKSSKKVTKKDDFLAMDENILKEF